MAVDLQLPVAYTARIGWVVQLIPNFGSGMFCYEDLYYGNFNPLFNEFEIEYNELYYKEFLDTTNKYRIGDIITKKTNSLI